MRFHFPLDETSNTTLAISLGKEIEKARHERGLSLHAAAEAAELPLKLLAAVERGEAPVTIQTIERVAYAVDWRWELLFTRLEPCVCCGGERRLGDV